MELRSLKVADCFELPTNPRGEKFDKTEFAELVASVKEQGVLMPVLARPSGKKFEIVAGNRRLRAAKEAGLTEIPAQVSELSDTEAREAQIVENLQRADIHPLDEAAAYRDLIEQSKPRMEIASVAAKVGKSESYVRQRLALTQLDAKIAGHVRTGEISIAHGLLIARLEKSDQPAAYAFATQYTEVVPLSRLRDYITRTVLSEAMKNPPWENDEQAKALIARITGLKGGEKNLFGEAASEKIENPAEYARALAAYMQLKIEEYKSKGKPLTLVSSYYSTTTPNVVVRGQYSTKDEAYYGDKKCKVLQDALIAEGSDMGKLIKICTDQSCSVHHSVPKPKTPAQKAAARTLRKKERDATDRKKSNDLRALEVAIGKFAWPLTEKQLGVLLSLAIANARFDTQKNIATRRDLRLGKERSWGGYDYDKAIETASGKMTPKEKLGLLFELIVPACSSYDSDQRSRAFRGL